ncbi:DNA helicase II [Marinomonas sp. UCMA 3892]|jgi:DNA helicase II / ATP-dependent DNA helicase PcrA|uniref:DNA helicase II n=1 Tax=unclassified Marinomonas TaxID=196814 RepID=UPI00146CFD5D|nr:DNA helicase II [Marinomonas sp. UCMA 3892]NLU97914.1 DNA helicase II [Marinomonas sp. UCMA 3892]
MDVSFILDSLNDKQREAVAAPLQNSLVLAGAGSGKTRVLVHRIAWLMHAYELSPYSLMAVTFTNKAAREMQGRIEQLVGVPPQGMWVGTFHGLAHRLLRAHWRDAGLKENFQIMDSDDQLRLIKRIMRELNIDDTRWPPKQVSWFINAQKDEGRRAAHVPDSHDPFSKGMRELYYHYEEACERGGLLDFGELLLRAHELMLSTPALLRHYQERFRHVLVDEFQDTNTIQYAWLRIMVGSQGTITAVGDDDQSIYGWRGAKIENIQNFTKDFKDVSTIRLEQNYRSTGHILKAANGLIKHNDDRLGKELWTDSGEGDPISLYAGFNEQDEARFIIGIIKQWRDKGTSLTDMAILYRSNAQSRVIEECLVREQIAYRIYGGHRFYDRLEIKNALAYARLALDPNDDGAMERVINVPPRGIGERSIGTLREIARDNGCSMWQAAQEVVRQSLMPGRATNAIKAFLHLIEGLSTTVQQPDLNLNDIFEQIIEEAGLIPFHEKEKGEKGEARIENLKELVGAAGGFSWSDEDEEFSSPLMAFLDKAVLDAGDAQADEYQDAVQLMTLHSAKGLEFPLVFLTGVEENIFPSKMSFEEPGRLAEERRLCYVGITRAMEKLYITYAESRRLFGSESFNSPSRFIKELPPECLEEVRLRSQVSRPVSLQRPDYNFEKNKLQNSSVLNNYKAPEVTVNMGDRVNHPVFGEGLVINYEGQGPQARVQVNFDDEGTKWLVLSFAKLEVL